ncbi:efflux RND transporter periplasmic adaptor subunit [Noviherbaspirillum massiliense]|uniref:efflux RND transporter periplasmic adaptor subunit n=1 Tax=Noviherbaspirillum massiliense TaxID=1465823 RepID=UPI00031872AC|nr:efflux RND transporter periplasmic adaptor subunit [Noviherbaspirillum massiliense]
MSKRILVLLVVVAIGMAAWYASTQSGKGKSGAGAASQQPATVVSIVDAAKMDVPVQLTANGYVSSLNSVDVRPQVSNIVAKVHIREGQFVKAGDILFTLDDRADKVNLQKAEAQVAKDKATLADLERQLARSQDLVGKGFIAQSAVDTVRAQVEAQRATLQADMAAANAARVALGYDTIRASSAGRAGAINVYPGSLVQPSSPPLVTISQLDPIAVSFTLPESELNGLLAAQNNGGIKVSASVQDAKKPLEGRLSFIDNTVDAQNGTIRVKAVFPNGDHLLWPGQYVTVSTTVRELKDVVVVPQAAIITGSDSKSVYTIAADQTAQSKPVELVYAFGTRAVVKGIQPGEHIVVDGKQNLRPGARVKAAEAATGSGQNNGGQVKDGQKSAP